MILGDTHGNTKFIRNAVIPMAEKEKVEYIYQLGDFGYWEHTNEGRYFLDDVNTALSHAGITMITIAGNHDKTSLVEKNYMNLEGFYKVRNSIWHAANGTQWEYSGVSFVALGGAYSIDKQHRLQNEYVPESLWFPEEEMTDSALSDILGNLKDVKVDVILAHDKPFASNPMIKLLPIPECIPNQKRLQLAVNTLQPTLYYHGHLHARYRDTIRCGDNDKFTVVEGLGADVPNFNRAESSWLPSDAWEILDL